MCWRSPKVNFICQHVEYMQKITMLISYLLTKFHNFSVYFISGTWNTIWNFSTDLMGKCINVCVTEGVHWPGRSCRTKPQLGGPRRWPVSQGTRARRRQRKHRSHKVGLVKNHGRLAKWWLPDRILSRNGCHQDEEPHLGCYKYPPMLSTGIHTPYSRFSTCKGSGALVVA
jgi:hypothetical protein